ncbi:hypothetical protein, partial [Agrobacterium sp. OT33]|uniref:hypothetical protein n=1 Tax=Agrobacterium sp. OT33 TaxID=2815338 RepID=UPI001A8FFA4F
ISPLEGEMPGRAEGGKPHAPSTPMDNLLKAHTWSIGTKSVLRFSENPILKQKLRAAAPISIYLSPL